MSRDSRRDKSRSGLSELEADFERRLAAALQECAGGTWGLFESNPVPKKGPPEPSRVEARELLRLGAEIADLRERHGIFEEYWPLARFQHYHDMSDGNDPGEPRRAKKFLAEIAARRA